MAALLMLSSLGSFDLLNIMAASQDAGRQTDTQGKLKYLDWIFLNDGCSKGVSFLVPSFVL